MHSMEWISAVGDDATDLPGLFSDLVRLETDLWNLAETRLRLEHGLQLSWFEVMGVIDTTTGCRVVDIAEALSITIGGASKLVDRIERAGWCRRTPHPDDGRSSTIELTGPGRRLLTAARRTFSDELAIRLDGALSAGQLRRFATTVRTLRISIGEGHRR